MIRGNDNSSFVDSQTPVDTIEANPMTEMEYFDLLPKVLREAIANSHREIATETMYWATVLPPPLGISVDEMLNRIKTTNKTFENTTNKLLENGLYFRKAGEMFL